MADTSYSRADVDILTYISTRKKLTLVFFLGFIVLIFLTGMVFGYYMGYASGGALIGDFCFEAGVKFLELKGYEVNIDSKLITALQSRKYINYVDKQVVEINASLH